MNTKATKDEQTRTELLRSAETKMREALAGDAGEAAVLPPAVLQASTEENAASGKAAPSSSA
eukprot:10243918-Alexandrium_andersonii.AAC.1